MNTSLSKGSGSWLKEGLRALSWLFRPFQAQKELQTLQTPLSTQAQKAHHSNEPSSTEMAEETSSSSYREKYFEHLVHCALDFEVVHLRSPFKLMLEDVFVEPNLAPALPFATQLSSPDITFVTSAFSANIWKYLATYHACVVLGPPGSGKTSLLLHITQTLTDAQKRFKNNALDKLPVLLFLRHHSQAINNKAGYTLLDAIQDSLTTSQISDALPANWFEKQLAQGQCLVMLDGLNEVPEAQREQVLIWIDRQIDYYSRSHFVVTSRPVGYRHEWHGMMVLEIQPFSNEQAQCFVKRWHMANKPRTVTHNRGKDNGSDTRHQTEELLRLCSSPPFSTEVTSPLLLTMMTIAFRDHGSLPRHRLDLYTENVELMLSSKEYGHGFNLTPAQKRRVLQPLAYQMMLHNLIEIGVDEAEQVIYVALDIVSGYSKSAEFLQLIATQSGLLRQSGGKYRFCNLFYQEYLAVLHLVERRLLDELTKLVGSSWWHETIHLYCMQSDTTQIMVPSLRQIMDKRENNLPALQLAIRCAQESAQIKPEMVHKLESILALEVDASDPVWRRIVAQALLARRIKGMMRVNQNLYVADSLITNAEYRLFIEEQRIRQVDASSNFKKPFLTGSGKKPVTDIRSSDAVAFCQWLTERDKSGFCYRLPYSGEFSPLVSKIAYWTQKKSEQAYELEKEQERELSLNALESRLRFLITRDITLHPDSALARIRVLEHALTQAFNQQGESNRAVGLALARDFVHDRAHDRLLNECSDENHVEEVEESAWYAHFVAWLVTEKLLALLAEKAKPGSWLELFDRHRIILPPILPEEQTLAEDYFELYTDLANLEERSLDKLWAAHGIRIIAERIRESKSERKIVATRPIKPRRAEGASPVTLSNQRRVLQKKICLLGDERVGKTSLVRRFVEGRFDERYLSTMGVSISRKTVERPSVSMNMLIWDMEGAEGFKKMQLNYLRGAAGALIVCDLTRRKTLAAFERYARQLRTLNPTMPIVFVGNKVDLEEREITRRDLDAFCAKLDGHYLLTSAKTGTQVEESFALLADLIERQTNPNPLNPLP